MCASAWRQAGWISVRPWNKEENTHFCQVPSPWKQSMEHFFFFLIADTVWVLFLFPWFEMTLVSFLNCGEGYMRKWGSKSLWRTVSNMTDHSPTPATKPERDFCSFPRWTWEWQVRRRPFPRLTFAAHGSHSLLSYLRFAVWPLKEVAMDEV